MDKKQTISNLLDKKKRWLVLKPRQLYVYNSSDDKEYKEAFPLSAMRIEVCKLTVIQWSSTNNKNLTLFTKLTDGFSRQGSKVSS